MPVHLVVKCLPLKLQIFFNEHLWVYWYISVSVYQQRRGVNMLQSKNGSSKMIAV